MFRLFEEFSKYLGFQTQQVSNQNIQVSQGGHNDSFPKDILLEIFGYLSPESLHTARCVCKEWKRLASEDSLWKLLLQKESLNGRIKNLDNSDLKLTALPTAHLRQLFVAAKIACRASENGSSTILTIPANWSWSDLEKINEKVINHLLYIPDELRTQLQKLKIVKEQTVILTDTVVIDSRNKSVKDQKKLLAVKKLENELPDMLTILTVTLLTYIVTEKNTRLYNWDEKTTWARCSNKTAEGYHMLVGLSPKGLDINHYYNKPDVCNEGMGVGGCLRFFKA